MLPGYGRGEGGQLHGQRGMGIILACHTWDLVQQPYAGNPPGQAGTQIAMTSMILIAPSTAGKTECCIARIRELRADQLLAESWVLLPDRFQTAAFRRRLAAAGGGVGVHIGTFGDLYHALLARAGRPIPVASDSIVHALIKTAIRDAMDRGELAHYGPIAEKPGFIRTLRDRFAELKRARVFPEALEEAARERGPALLELARLYAAYQARLHDLGWADPEGVNWLAVEALEQQPALAAGMRLLVVDGFDSFNGAQLAALKLLDAILPEMVITLPGTPQMERAAHRRFARALAALQAVIPDAQVRALSDSPHLPEALARLERGLFESPPERAAGEGRVTFIEASTTADEAREALRWIKARIVRDDLRPEACALVTPDPERYRPHLREAGAEFGLPLRFTHGEALASAPGVAALLDLLQLPLRDWPRRLTLETLRTPYFDLTTFRLGPREADLLELVSRYGQVIGGLAQWEEALGRLARIERPPHTEDGESLARPDLPAGDSAASLWGRLQAFAERLAPPTEMPIRDWVRWLEDLLDELRFFERQETHRDEASAAGLRETLRALVLRDQVADPSAGNYEAFLNELRSTLEGTYYQERHAWSRPSILVLRVLEARGLRFKAVAVLGLSEGLFPEVEREDPFLDEAVRSALGLEPRLEREQAGLFYQAVTRADRFLLLTRPALAEDGERWDPSPFWSAARALFTEERLRIQPEAPRPLADAASPEEILFLAVRRGGLPQYYADLLPRYKRLRRARDVLNARLTDDGLNRFEGEASAIADLLAERYRHWSPSRLETYGSCPHWFYVAHALQLEAVEPPELGLDPSQLGLILHAILEKAYREAEDPRDPEAVLKVLEEAAAAEFEAAPERYGFRPSPLWEVEQDHLLERLAKTVRGLAELGGDWTPVAFEVVFGREGAPPLVLDLEGRQVRLHGVIDRVDRNEERRLRILDYKTGSSGLAAQDLVEGRRLQLPLYALAAQEALGMGEAVEGLYWAILSGRPGSLKLSKFSHKKGSYTYQGPEGAVQLARAHVGGILDGVHAGAFRPQPPPGGCPAYCPAAAWCWKYASAGW